MVYEDNVFIAANKELLYNEILKKNYKTVRAFQI